MRFFFLCMTICATLFAERGIVVACNNKYAKSLHASLLHLRNHLHCQLPCEVWYAGSELSQTMIQAFCQIDGVLVHDVLEQMPPPASEYWGWHVKPVVMALCRFDEVLLMDADLFFFENPEILFEHPKYIERGAYFFRDRRIFVIPYQQSGIQNRFAKERGNFPFYKEQCKWLKSIIATPSESMPLDWKHYWTGDLPTAEHPFSTEKQEAGCVLVNKRVHEKGLNEVLQLNRDRKFVYGMVYGDKETYWIGFEIAKEPYYVNEEHAMTLYQGQKREVNIVQFLDGKLFYQQKEPVKASKDARLYEHLTGYREITQEEFLQFETLYQGYNKCR